MRPLSPIFGILLLVLTSACTSGPTPAQSALEAPVFALPSLEGEVVSLEDFRGRVVVIHFGTSWCPFCRAEDPHLEALFQTYKDRGVQALVVNVSEAEAAAAGWWKEAGFSFPMLLDRDGAVAARYAPSDAQPDLPRHEVMIASNLVVDRNGSVRFFSLLDSRAFDARLIALRACLDEVLAEGGEGA